MRRRTFLAASVSAATVACSSGTTVDPEPSPTPSNLAAQTISDQGPVTLTVWDQEVLAGQNAQIEALNAQFQEEFPNVTVRRLSQSFDDLRKQSAMALPGDDVPDVVQVSNTRADMGAFVAEELLLGLDDHAVAYGWNERFPASVLQGMRYSADGLTFGEGGLYGLPQTGSIVGFYYRQQTLDQLGGEMPATWEDLFALIDEARGAGMQPMVLGNLEKWPALHVLGALQNAYVPTDDVLALALGKAGASWVTEGNVQALTKLASWSADGYFGDSPNGVDYETAARSFVEGKAAFFLAGSWLAADLEQEVEEGLRFMPPPPGLDGTPASSGGTGVPWAIPAHAQNPDVAAAYLDFITRPEAMGTIAANGNVPVLRTVDLAPEAGVNLDIFEAFTTVTEQGVLVPFLDNATPTFGDTAGTALQDLIGGQKDPEAVAETLQADYAGFVS